VTHANVIVGVYSIMEDESGDVVKVALYNALADGVPNHPQARYAAANSVLPRGQAVAIVEPYYKMFADGTRGVRVDNPNDLRAWCLWKLRRRRAGRS